MNWKKLNLALVVFVFGVASFKAYAKKGEWTKLKKADVFFSIPSKWNSYKDMLGLPLVLVGPKKESSRITISLTPTGLKKLFLIPDELEANQNDYKNGRRKYIREIKGEIKEFFPYETKKWKNVERVHTIGFKYVLGGHTFVERTYYFTCKTQMFHMKSKYRENEFPDGNNVVNEIVKSFNCR